MVIISGEKGLIVVIVLNNPYILVLSLEDNMLFKMQSGKVIFMKILKSEIMVDMIKRLTYILRTILLCKTNYTP